MRRTSFFILLFVLFYWSVSLAADIPSAPTNVRIVEPPVPFPREFSVPRSVSRTSGVAPLSVHFIAGFSDSSPTERGFHNYDYSWNFGDPSSGIWGTSEKSKNEAKGPVAAHVFETTGSYTVTLTVRDASGVVDTDTFDITVTDSDIVYSGINTTCICDTIQNDFTGCPAGARQVATDDLSTITGYADAGKRILFHRGSSWTSSGTDFPDNSGPVTIGAYGSCSSPDDLGICSNAPKITLTGNFCDLSRKQNWRFSDIYFSGGSSVGGIFGGVMDMQRILMLRLKAVGFSTPIGISHYNNYPDDLIDNIVVVSCDVSGGDTMQMYLGSERLALLGNIVKDSARSHVVRVWQAYLSVISHNIISGASLNTNTGRHALKLHGPGTSSFDGSVEYCTPAHGNICLANRTEFVVVSDNVFGSSGPWPVSIGPQDAAYDSILSDIIFERNRIHSDYGSQSSTGVQIAVGFEGRYFTARNNILDGTGSTDSYTGFNVWQRGIEPAPVGVEIYNNTIYRSDNGTNIMVGIAVENVCTDTIIRNNLASFPNCTGSTTMIINDSGDGIFSNNIMTNTPGLVAPNNAIPLSRDFSLQSGSPAIGQGVPVLVYDDFAGNNRPNGSYDLGSFEYYP